MKILIFVSVILIAMKTVKKILMKSYKNIKIIQKFMFVVNF